MYYTQEELVRGSTVKKRYNKKGRYIGDEHTPLDPALYKLSMDFYHPKPPPPVPKPAEQTNATLASIGKGLRRPESESKRKKTTLASLRIRPRTKVNQQLGGQGGTGSGLNIGGFA